MHNHTACMSNVAQISCLSSPCTSPPSGSPPLPLKVKGFTKEVAHSPEQPVAAGVFLYGTGQIRHFSEARVSIPLFHVFTSLATLPPFPSPPSRPCLSSISSFLPLPPGSTAAAATYDEVEQIKNEV